MMFRSRSRRRKKLQSICPADFHHFWNVLLLLGTQGCDFLEESFEAGRGDDAHQPTRPGAGWQRTAERFVDDATDKPVTVYIEPATGERSYVQE